MKNIWIIAKKEFWGYLNSPTAYIVAGAFLLPSYFLFWRGTMFSGEASMRTYFSLLPWFLLLLAPALTMRSLSDEKRQSTLELMMAHAMSEWQLVVGKFLGSWLFYASLLAVTLSLPFTMAQFATLDTGQLVAQYIGALLVGGGFLALGIMVSSWMNNVITSFMAASALCFVWIILGLEIVLIALPWPLNSIISELGVMNHIEQIARGVISLRDVTFFAVAILIFLLLAIMKLSEPKTAESTQKRASLYTGFGLLLAIGAVLAIASYNWPYRVDLTANQRYTLSEATLQTLGNVPDVVSLTLYSTQQLPAQYQIAKREIVDTLRDYVRYGKGNVRFSVIDPGVDPEAAQRAGDQGIQRVQFETLSSGRFAVEAGYLGLVIGYGDKTETIPFIQDPANLEYDLTRRIRKLTADENKVVGIVSGQGEKQEYTDLQVLAQNLRTEYDVQTVDLTSQKPTKEMFDALLVVGPTAAVEATATAAMDEYLKNGGRAMFLLDTIQPNTQLGTASTLDPGWNPVLSQFGITLNQNLVYDVQYNQPISITQGPLQYSIPYPYWVVAIPNKEFAPVSGLEGVILGWPSSLTVNAGPDMRVTELLRTSQQGGGVQEGALMIAPDNAPQTGQGKSEVVAVSIEKGSTKVVVVGDADLAGDDFTRYKAVNAAFVSNLTDWLTTEEGQTVVQKKNFSPPVLKMQPNEAVIAEYGNLLGVPLLVSAFGFWWLRRRRNRAKRILTLEQKP